MPEAQLDGLGLKQSPPLSAPSPRFADLEIPRRDRRVQIEAREDTQQIQVSRSWESHMAKFAKSAHKDAERILWPIPAFCEVQSNSLWSDQITFSSRQSDARNVKAQAYYSRINHAMRRAWAAAARKNSDLPVVVSFVCGSSRNTSFRNDKHAQHKQIQHKQLWFKSSKECVLLGIQRTWMCWRRGGVRVLWLMTQLDMCEVFCDAESATG